MYFKNLLRHSWWETCEQEQGREIAILRNSSQKDLGVLRGAFRGFGCPKRHPGALLAKTMNKNVPKMFTGLLGPVKLFFYWAEANFGNCYWPGASGSLLALSPVTLRPYWPCAV